MTNDDEHDDNLPDIFETIKQENHDARIAVIWTAIIMILLVVCFVYVCGEI